MSNGRDDSTLGTYRVTAICEPDSTFVPDHFGGCQFYELRPTEQPDEWPHPMLELHAKFQEDNSVLSREGDVFLVPEGYVPDDLSVGDAVSAAEMVSALKDSLQQMVDILNGIEVDED